jgi:hypothetical protein
MHNLGVENKAMRVLLSKIDWRSQDTAIPASVTSMLEQGLVHTGDALVFRSLVKNAHAAPDRFPDSTGYEAFVNKFTLDCESELDAARVGHRCADAIARFLQNGTDLPCRVILSIDETSAIIRFHVRRPGERWLAESLAGYEEPLLALDIPESLA